MDNDSWVKNCREVVVEGHRVRGMDKDSWVKNCREVVAAGHIGGRSRPLGMKLYKAILEC